jgi:hypothetical protein
MSEFSGEDAEGDGQVGLPTRGHTLPRMALR